jgi:hydrogenase nickel incorporation protein HypA/HybF
MHELSLCQALIRQAERVARDHDAPRITHLHVRIGRLSGVEADLLQQAFFSASRDTAAEGSVLHLEHSPVRIHCPACARDAEVEINHLACPHCGHWQTRLIGGDELLLVSVDLGHSRERETEHV